MTTAAHDKETYINFDLADIEQIGAWLDRLRSDGRRFDHVQGYFAGLACASPLIGEPWDELLLAAIQDDPYEGKIPPGLVREEILDTLGELYSSIEDSLGEGDFRPYIQGRYRNRIPVSLDCREWCQAFSRTFLLFKDDIREDEELGTFLVPFLILAEPEGKDSILAELAEDERPAALDLARSRLIEGVFSLHDYIAETQEAED